MIDSVKPYDVTAADSPDQDGLPDNVRTGIPDAGWSPQELSDRADWEIGKLRRDKKYAAIYWWLGKVLLVVREDLDQRGEWTAWRQKHNIDRTKAQRAQLFARVFKSVKQVEPLSVTRAERLIREQQGRSEATTDEEQRIRRRVRQVMRKTVPDTLKDLAAMAETDCVLPLILEVGELYRQVLEAAERKARSVARERATAADHR